MVSEKLIELWKRTGREDKLREHGILEEPTTDIQTYSNKNEASPFNLNYNIREIKPTAKPKMNKPVSFRPTPENLLFLKQQSDKTAIINRALEFWRKRQ